MKKHIFISAAILSMVLTWTGCNRAEEEGSVSFGLELSEEAALKSASSRSHIDAALVTIKDRNGALIYDKEYLPVYKFGDQFTTRSLKIPVGMSQLTEFMLVDSMGVVLWATPVEGSNLAHLVRKPLPISFEVAADQTTSIPIQVVRVGNYHPDDFGYANFQIGFVDRFCLKVLYATRCLEEWNDSILTPTISGAPIFEPRLTIVVGDRVLVDEPLHPGLNHFEVPMVDRWYVIEATDCHGNQVYARKFTLPELLEHRCQTQFKPLVINREDPGVIITPEGLIEPTINQGLFGQITVPVDDSTDFERYDFQPVVRDVYIFPWSVMDSIYTFAPINCYLSPDMIGMEPLVKVRSNSQGYFQVPLRVGEYLYVVKEGDRYYIESHLSSRRGGYAIIHPDEVLKLLIHIVDCSMWM